MSRSHSRPFAGRRALRKELAALIFLLAAAGPRPALASGEGAPSVDSVFASPRIPAPPKAIGANERIANFKVASESNGDTPFAVLTSASGATDNNALAPRAAAKTLSPLSPPNANGERDAHARCIDVALPGQPLFRRPGASRVLIKRGDAVQLVRSERFVLDQDRNAHLDLEDFWFDGRTLGVRSLAVRSVALSPIATIPRRGEPGKADPTDATAAVGTLVYGYREGTGYHVIVPAYSANTVEGNGATASQAHCGHAHVVVRPSPSEGGDTAAIFSSRLAAPLRKLAFVDRGMVAREESGEGAPRSADAADDEDDDNTNDDDDQARTDGSDAVDGAAQSDFALPAELVGPGTARSDVVVVCSVSQTSSDPEPLFRIDVRRATRSP